MTFSNSLGLERWLMSEDLTSLPGLGFWRGSVGGGHSPPNPVRSYRGGVCSEWPRRPWAQRTCWSGSEKGARKGEGRRVSPQPGMWLGHEQPASQNQNSPELTQPTPLNNLAALPASPMSFSGFLAPDHSHPDSAHSVPQMSA